MAQAPRPGQKFRGREHTAATLKTLAGRGAVRFSSGSRLQHASPGGEYLLPLENRRTILLESPFDLHCPLELDPSGRPMRFQDHAARLLYQAGKRVKLGKRDYRVRGYLSTNVAMGPRDHEQHLLTVFERHLSGRPGAFMDVGVNIGQTLFKLLKVDPDREYYGFEPLISCCNDVSRFISDNRLPNATVLAVGLGNVNGICKLYSHGPHDSTASFLQEEDTSVSLVPIRIGDDVISEIGIPEVALIKVDVEGAEWQVFDGLRKTLARDKPALVFEVLPNFEGHARVSIDPAKAERNRQNAAHLGRVLAAAGYSVHQIGPDGSEVAVQTFNLDDPSSFVGADYSAIFGG